MPSDYYAGVPMFPCDPHLDQEDLRMPPPLIPASHDQDYQADALRATIAANTATEDDIGDSASVAAEVAAPTTASPQTTEEDPMQVDVPPENDFTPPPGPSAEPTTTTPPAPPPHPEPPQHQPAPTQARNKSKPNLWSAAVNPFTFKPFKMKPDLPLTKPHPMAAKLAHPPRDLPSSPTKRAMENRERQNQSRDSLTANARKIFDDNDVPTTDDALTNNPPPMDTEDSVQLAEEQNYKVPTFPVRSKTNIKLQSGSRVWIPINFPDLPNAINTFWKTQTTQTLAEKGFSCIAFTFQSHTDGLPAVLVTYHNPGQPAFILSKGQRIGNLYAFLQ